MHNTPRKTRRPEIQIDSKCHCWNMARKPNLEQGYGHIPDAIEAKLTWGICSSWQRCGLITGGTSTTLKTPRCGTQNDVESCSWACGCINKLENLGKRPNERSPHLEHGCGNPRKRHPRKCRVWRQSRASWKPLRSRRQLQHTEGHCEHGFKKSKLEQSFDISLVSTRRNQRCCW